MSASTLVQPSTRRPLILRLLAYAIETHPPLTYALVAGGWSWSVMAMLANAKEHGAASAFSQIGASGWLVSLAFFLILLYLRAVDEVKDLAYDRLHNPDRPLVRGAVSVNESWLLAALVALLVWGISASLNASLVLVATAQMAYGLMLFVLERHWARFRESTLLNLIVTFPVSAALNGYAAGYLHGLGLLPAPGLIAAVVAAHIAVFLHMEFGRKLKWPHLSDASENGYALALGVPGAVAVCTALGLLGCSLSSWVHALSGAGAWAALPWLALLPSTLGLLKFAAQREHTVELKPFFGGAMILFFLLNVAVVWARG